jgi:predicted membrane channel-forming protein YqfA (hemolysin III family)
MLPATQLYPTIFVHLGGSIVTFVALAYTSTHERRLRTNQHANDIGLATAHLAGVVLMLLASLPVWWHCNKEELREIAKNRIPIARQATRNCTLIASAWSITLFFAGVGAALAVADVSPNATALGTTGAMGVMMQLLFLCSTLPYPPLPHPIPDDG